MSEFISTVWYGAKFILAGKALRLPVEVIVRCAYLEFELKARCAQALRDFSRRDFEWLHHFGHGLTPFEIPIWMPLLEALHDCIVDHGRRHFLETFTV